MGDVAGFSAQLRVLEQKGHVRHEELGLRYVYVPTVPRHSARRSALTFGEPCSTRETRDLETPARFDKASSESPSAWRSLTKVSPTLGGASSKFFPELLLIWLTTSFLCIIVEFLFDISN